jgi:predicted O-linked N-acetylglucosamine transferase (SPINDLY family)
LEGQRLAQAGKWDAALQVFRNGVKRNPSSPQLLAGLGHVAARTGHLAEAEQALGQLARLRPRDPAAQLNLGGVLAAAGRHGDAEAAFRAACRLEPKNVAAQYNLARCLSDQGATKAAEDGYRAVLELAPHSFEASFNLGVLLFRRGQYEEAEQINQRLLQANPGRWEPRLQLGRVWQAQGRSSEARAAFREVLERFPGHPQAQLSLSLSLLGDRDIAPAEELIVAAESSNKLRREELTAARAMLLAAKGQTAEAITRLSGVLDSGVGAVSHYAQVADWLAELRRRDEAVEVLKAGAARFSGAMKLRAMLLINQRHICDWTDAGAASAVIDYLREAPSSPISPFAALSLPGLSAGALQHLTRAYAARFKTASPLPRVAPPESPLDRRLRIGYLSSDFHEHATAYLAASVFECHDRTRFEVFAYSFGPDDKSSTRARLIDAFEHFVDIRSLAHGEAARKIREDEIDILVDLKGYTRGARPEILAQRPAPLQVSWLGYPGTMGVPFIDYLIADETVVPPADAADYDEALAYLPDTYQPIDTKRAVGDAPTRASMGLPETGVVLCSFNNARKITPEVFDCWCEVLREIPDAVLWLFAEHQLVATNLRREAQQRGVAPERLLFAPRATQADHLARLRLADLALDTLPYNGHTTASDALWMGIPVLTCRGSTFPARVAASLLAAVGLPELVTNDLAQYRDEALALAGDPAKLLDCRRRLVASHKSSPYFDSAKFARDLEALYQRMWSNHQAGRPPMLLAPEATVLG